MQCNLVIQYQYKSRQQQPKWSLESPINNTNKESSINGTVVSVVTAYSLNEYK